MVKRQLTESARASKMIKQILKKQFPTTKFSVKSSNFSMGDSVHIDWTDGATTKQVEKFTKKFQGGWFDGMEDMYHYNKKKANHPTAKYVQTQRNMSDKVRGKLIKKHNKKWSDEWKIKDWDTAGWDKRKFIHDAFQDTSFKNAVVKRIKKKRSTPVRKPKPLPKFDTDLKLKIKKLTTGMFDNTMLGEEAYGDYMKGSSQKRQIIRDQAKMRTTERNKYIAVDRNTSGLYLVQKADDKIAKKGHVWGIKGYGQRGGSVGHIDKLNEKIASDNAKLKAKVMAKAEANRKRRFG